MTNHWIDIRNSDCILVMGSNAAENHPLSFRWVSQAKDRGAVLVSVDPRFTRTSAQADFFASLRSGTDIAFLGGMIRYIIEKERFNREYLVEYTDAPCIVRGTYDFHDGLFSGYDPSRRRYDRHVWGFEIDGKGIPRKDPSLRDPRCVFQLLKNHFNRYDLDRVSAVTGTPREDLRKVYEMFSETGRNGRAGTIMYAMGWTQHTVGTQNIRTMAIIQLLLGNMGIAGGGVNALRGESNVQGSTDHGILFHLLPGYLKAPRASQRTLADYNRECTPATADPLSANWWSNYAKYSVSLLTSLFGDKATRDNGFGYDWLPKVDDGVSCSWLDLFDAMYRGEIKGLFAWGQNPAGSGAHAGKTRKALARLDWMVNVNIFPNETGWFFQGPGVDPGSVGTEVFFLPCAVSLEKEGSITNSGRWSQWRYRAAEPPGEARSDGEIMVNLMEKVRDLYGKDAAAPFPEPILHLKWDYTTAGRYDPHRVAREINGYFQQDRVIAGAHYRKGDLVPGFALLQSDGSTSSGNWLYCNSYTEQGNMAARRTRETAGIGLHAQWAWCWPVNRRILYNRASVDRHGKPWDASRPVIRWETGEGDRGRWVGDVPDGGWPPLSRADGTPNPASRRPFIMKPDGLASLFGPGMVDGPFPEHYEPVECPVKKNLFSRQRVSPVVPTYGTDLDVYASCDPRYPYVATTFRVSEHWQSGVMTRWQPWLLETQPQLFVEMSLELAGELGIRGGDAVVVESPRGRIRAVAVVTARFRPFQVGGEAVGGGSLVHQIGIPWHYGWIHPEDGGDSANLLTPATGDANTGIPETKAFMVNLRKADA